MLPAKQLSAHFVSQSIISTKDEEEIIKPTTSSMRAATMLLSMVINPLRAGFENCSVNFYKFVEILQQHGSESLKTLSTIMAQKVEELKAEVDLKGTLCWSKQSFLNITMHMLILRMNYFCTHTYIFSCPLTYLKHPSMYTNIPYTLHTNTHYVYTICM